MNILIVHPCKGFYGGAEEVVVQLTRHLPAAGHKVEIATKDMPNWNVYPAVCNNAMSWTQLRQDVRRGIRWNDAVLCFNFPATLAAYGSKKPVVWYCNEPPELFSTWWREPIEAFHRRYVRKSKMRCVVATPFDANRFEQIYKVKPEVVPYGIDYDFWSKGERYPATVERHGRLYKSNQVRLLQVGTVSAFKNQKASIEVVGKLLEVGVNATLDFAGRIECDMLVSENVRDRVKFLGQCTQEQIRELYYNHDILLHPVLGQGGWLVPLEAWCTNIPVITVPEFQMSSLFDYVANSPQEAANMVVDIIENGSKQFPGLWIKEAYSWNRFGESITRILEEETKC